MNKLALLLVACLAALTAFAADVPYLSGRVVDNAEILGAETKQKLAAQLKAHEAETTNQIAVLTVPSLEGESVESYAEQVFNTWKLGRKGKDNGGGKRVNDHVSPCELRIFHRHHVGGRSGKSMPDDQRLFDLFFLDVRRDAVDGIDPVERIPNLPAIQREGARIGTGPGKHQGVRLKLVGISVGEIGVRVFVAAQLRDDDDRDRALAHNAGLLNARGLLDLYVLPDSSRRKFSPGAEAAHQRKKQYFE